MSFGVLANELGQSVDGPVVELTRGHALSIVKEDNHVLVWRLLIKDLDNRDNFIKHNHTRDISSVNQTAIQRKQTLQSKY